MMLLSLPLQMVVLTLQFMYLKTSAKLITTGSETVNFTHAANIALKYITGIYIDIYINIDSSIQ